MFLPPWPEELGKGMRRVLRFQLKYLLMDPATSDLIPSIIVTEN